MFQNKFQKKIVQKPLNFSIETQRNVNLINQDRNIKQRSESKRGVRRSTVNENTNSRFSKNINYFEWEGRQNKESINETERIISIFYGSKGILSFLNSILNIKNYKSASKYMLEYIISIISKLKELKYSESNLFYKQLIPSKEENLDVKTGKDNKILDYRSFQKDLIKDNRENHDSKINTDLSQNESPSSRFQKYKSELYDENEELKLDSKIKEENLVSSLIDKNDNYFQTLKEGGNNFMQFSSLISYQYLIFEAYYRYKHNEISTLESIVEVE